MYQASTSTLFSENHSHDGHTQRTYMLWKLKRSIREFQNMRYSVFLVGGEVGVSVRVLPGFTR